MKRIKRFVYIASTNPVFFQYDFAFSMKATEHKKKKNLTLLKNTGLQGSVK